MATAQRLVGCKTSTNETFKKFTRKRMGLPGLSGKLGFTSSKATAVTSEYRASLRTGITMHTAHLTAALGSPHPAKPIGKPIASWSGRLEKQLSQRVSIKLLLLVSPERLFFTRWQRSQRVCHLTQPYLTPAVCHLTPPNSWCHPVFNPPKGDSLKKKKSDTY